LRKKLQSKSGRAAAEFFYVCGSIDCPYWDVISPWWSKNSHFCFFFRILAVVPTDLSVVSWDNSDSSADVGVGSGGGRLSSGDQGGKQAQPTRMKPLPVSLIFDMRFVPFIIGESFTN